MGRGGLKSAVTAAKNHRRKQAHNGDAIRWQPALHETIENGDTVNGYPPRDDRFQTTTTSRNWEILSKKKPKNARVKGEEDKETQ